MKIEIRFAHDSDGPRVAEIAEALGLVFEDFTIDWSRLEPNWIVAEGDDRVVAAMQVLVGTPIGRMDYLLLDPDLSKRERAVVTKRITDRALSLLKMAGAQLAGSYIGVNRDDQYLAVAKKRGWIEFDRLVSLLKRLV